MLGHKRLFSVFIGLALAFYGAKEMAAYQEKSFIRNAFVIKAELSFFVSDSTVSRELACQRAWDSFKKLMASATAFEAMRREFFSWQEIGIPKAEAIYNHQLLINLFYNDMELVFKQGGPVEPWLGLSAFPKDMESVKIIMAFSCVPIFVPKNRPEQDRLPPGVFQL